MDGHSSSCTSYIITHPHGTGKARFLPADNPIPIAQTGSDLENYAGNSFALEGKTELKAELRDYHLRMRSQGE